MFYDELYTWSTTIAKGQKAAQEFYLGYVGDELKFFSIETKSLGSLREPYNIKKPIYDDWESLVSNINTNGPVGLNNSF